MKNELNEEDIRQLASQLRKPEGEHGVKIGEMMNQGNAPMNLHTLAVLNPQPNETILEIGMGNGHFVRNILLLGDSISYTGCDYSELMVEQATAKNSYFVKAGSARFIKTEAVQLPFDDQSFDKVFTVNTFYFWDNHKEVLAELRRVLRAGGGLIVAVRPKDNLIKFPPTRFGFAIWSNEEILALLRAGGFDQIETTEIKEPDQEREGEVYERQTVIFNCKKS